MKRLSALTLFCTALFCAADYPAAVPGFNSASIYTSAGADGTVLQYRESKTGEWLPALNMVLSPDGKELRGSLFKLQENTAYEYRILHSGKTETGSFTTQASEVPVARTIILNNENFKGYLKLTESGTADGYIRYTTAPGTVLQADFKHKEAILAENIKYVILDGLTIRGGGHHILHLKNCENFRVVNCDLGNYGTPREPLDLSPSKDKEEGSRKLKHINGKYINNQSPIEIRGGRNILIERNFLHDPRCHATPWFYTHPWGPSGIHYSKATGLTIRWNDIIGSDHHRWNDIIESLGNGHLDGGPRADAEIYGNYLAFGNDDAIELDGGQKNIRFFGNLMEGTFCGVSTAPCMEGPSYIVNNLFIRPGDEFGNTNAAIKNGGFTYYPGRIHVFRNTLCGPAAALSSYFNSEKVTPEQAEKLKSVVKNNLFIDCRPIHRGFWKLRNELDYNLYSGTGNHLRLYPRGQGPHDREGQFAVNGKMELAAPQTGAGLPNIGSQIGISGDLPERPLALSVSAMSVNLSSKELSKSIAVKSNGYAGKLRMVQPEFSPFFRVEPEECVIKAGENIKLTVSARPEAAPEARLNCGAFLIRTPDGLSRPVSVYFDNRDDLAKVAAMRKQTVYGEVIPHDKRNFTLKFTGVPEGSYYLAIRMNPLRYQVILKVPGEKDLTIPLKKGVWNQRRGWAVVPWIQDLSRTVNTPRKISGNFSLKIESPGPHDLALVGCALIKTPEEILSAAGTVLPHEEKAGVSEPVPQKQK